jgi:hypothetical protein
MSGTANGLQNLANLLTEALLDDANFVGNTRIRHCAAVELSCHTVRFQTGSEQSPPKPASSPAPAAPSSIQAKY